LYLINLKIDFTLINPDIKAHAKQAAQAIPKLTIQFEVAYFDK
jgi:hypothetical protein